MDQPKLKIDGERRIETCTMKQWTAPEASIPLISVQSSGRGEQAAGGEIYPAVALESL